jgi:hypothetical protein
MEAFLGKFESFNFTKKIYFRVDLSTKISNRSIFQEAGKKKDCISNRNIYKPKPRLQLSCVRPNPAAEL